MKYKGTTAVVLGLLAALSILVYSPLLEQFEAQDLTQSEPKPIATGAQNNNSTLSRKPDNNGPLAPAKDQDQYTPTEFIISPDASELWPIARRKESLVVQRHNLISAWKIALDRQLIDELVANEQLNLYIPQTDRRVTITLHTIKSGRYSQSKIATIDGSNGAYSAYFTLGSDTLYGSIETPEGVFHIEQNSAGDAMIYAASEIRKNLDYSVSDAVVVLPPLNDVD